MLLDGWHFVGNVLFYLTLDSHKLNNRMYFKLEMPCLGARVNECVKYNLPNAREY